MSGKSPVTANGDQRVALSALAASRDRGEADRARQANRAKELRPDEAGEELIVLCRDLSAKTY